MSRAEPMSTQERVMHYQDQSPNGRLTPKQARRMNKKANKNPMIDSAWNPTLGKKITTTPGIEVLDEPKEQQ